MSVRRPNVGASLVQKRRLGYPKKVGSCSSWVAGRGINSSVVTQSRPRWLGTRMAEVLRPGDQHQVHHSEMLAWSRGQPNWGESLLRGLVDVARRISDGGSPGFGNSVRRCRVRFWKINNMDR